MLSVSAASWVFILLSAAQDAIVEPVREGQVELRVAIEGGGPLEQFSATLRGPTGEVIHLDAQNPSRSLKYGVYTVEVQEMGFRLHRSKIEVNSAAAVFLIGMRVGWLAGNPTTRVRVRRVGRTRPECNAVTMIPIYPASGPNRPLNGEGQRVYPFTGNPPEITAEVAHGEYVAVLLSATGPCGAKVVRTAGSAVIEVTPDGQ